jgi:hypothetical protein
VADENGGVNPCSVHDDLDIFGHLVERILLPAACAGACATLIDCDDPEPPLEEINLIAPERAYASEAGYEKDRVTVSDIFVIQGIAGTRIWHSISDLIECVDLEDA